MKTTLFVVFLLCAVAAFGQNAGVLSNQAVSLAFSDHPQHAETHAMAREQSLVGGSAYSIEHGEVPLWEFGPVAEKPSLGDVARAFRKEKQTAKKAEFVFEKQGS